MRNDRVHYDQVIVGAAVVAVDQPGAVIGQRMLEEVAFG